MITQSLKQLKARGSGPVSAGARAKTYVFVRAKSERSHAGFRGPIARGDFVHLPFLAKAVSNASVSLPLAGSACAGVVQSRGSSQRLHQFLNASQDPNEDPAKLGPP